MTREVAVHLLDGVVPTSTAVAVNVAVRRPQLDGRPRRLYRTADSQLPIVPSAGITSALTWIGV